MTIIKNCKQETNTENYKQKLHSLDKSLDFQRIALLQWQMLELAGSLIWKSLSNAGQLLADIVFFLVYFL